MKRATFAFYNLAPAGDPHRGPEQVRLELNAIANNHAPDPDRKRPKVIGNVECIDRHIPRLVGYHAPIRSTASKSRANVALHVSARLTLGRTEWVDLSKTWPRPLHPDAGPHEPRSILVQQVEDWTIVVGHAPQEPREVFARATNAAIMDARAEWLDAMVTLMQRTGPVLALTDPNALASVLVKRLGSTTVVGGDGTDSVIGRHVTILGAPTPGVVNGVRLLSDHKKCLLGSAVRR